MAVKTLNEKQECYTNRKFDDKNSTEAYKGTISVSFEAGSYNLIAVKIVDDRGIESLKVIEL